MKNYYYNIKTRDLAIFDTESMELLVLERIEGIRVFTSSELEHPTNFTDLDAARPTRGKDHEGFSEAERGFTRKRTAKKHGKDSQVKKCGYCHKTDHRGKDCPDKPTGKKSGRTITCKNCGEAGHFAKTCKKEPRSAPPQLPDSAIQEIAREEREAEIVV